MAVARCCGGRPGLTGQKSFNCEIPLAETDGLLAGMGICLRHGDDAPGYEFAVKSTDYVIVVDLCPGESTWY